MKKIFYTLLFAAATVVTACNSNSGSTGGATADSGATGNSGASDTSLSTGTSGTMGGSDTSTTGSGTTGPVTDTTRQNQQQPQQ